ncbi:MAG: hypothetical protein M1486_00145 [Gammaproteobacteria bacterium]|nr:hypothetical protein [Gammaproteobacteria bacterium]
MTNTQSSRGKIILIFISIIVFLIFLINFLLTYLANLFITTQIVPQFNDNKGNLALSAHIRLLPSIKLSVNNIEYKKENKTIIKINDLSVKIAFWQLFSKRLHVTKLSISDGVINLYNIPPVKWTKNTKATKTAEKRLEERKEINNNTSKATPKESFFELDAIELTNLQINYSPSKTSQPIYLIIVLYDNSQVNNPEHMFTLLGSWWNEPINATLTVNWSSAIPMFKTNLNFADNELFLTAQASKTGFQIQTHTAIKNRDILERFLSIPKMQLPTQINVTINEENNKLSISPIQIVFPTAVLHGTISLAGGSPIIIQMTLPEDLLITLAGSTIYQECPLPQTVRMLLKGVNTEVTIAMPESSIKEGEKVLIKIDGFGIQFEGNNIPNVLQKNMQTCFDYELPDESSETTTYSID